MAQEQGIAALVEELIAAGRPSSREQNIDDRAAAASPARGKLAYRLKIRHLMA